MPQSPRKPKRNYDFDIIRQLSPELMRKAAVPIVSMANKRLKRLENAGINFGVATRIKKELGRLGRVKFTATAQNIESELAMLQDFLSAETSTLTGIRYAQTKTTETLRKKYGLGIENPKEFFDFLSSEQFRVLKQQVDSNQLIEDIDSMLELGASLADIQEMYNEFLNTSITYDEAINLQLSKMGDMLR